MLAIDLEVRGINDAGAGSPRNYLLSLSFADLEIVIEKSSWVDRQGFAVFFHVLNCEIREFEKDERRIIFHMPGFFELFWNTGTALSIVTQGNLSSSQMAFCGANGAGSSSDAIVTSMISESFVSSKNK